jgi:hypothetical protein
MRASDFATVALRVIGALLPSAAGAAELTILAGMGVFGGARRRGRLRARHWASPIRPKPPGAHVTLRAEMDLLAAVSVCPDVSVGGTTGAKIAILGSSIRCA